jgi:hypothetical protein
MKTKTEIKIWWIILIILFIFILITLYFAFKNNFFEPSQINNLCNYTLNISNITK